jgi:hypothetical protein
MTRRERAMVRALRELCADDDGALEVLDALGEGWQEHFQQIAEMTSGEES